MGCRVRVESAGRSTNSLRSNRVPECDAAQPAPAPSSITKAIFTTTRNWVTWLFSTTASNSLAQTDVMLRIVRDARSTAWRIASSYPCEDWPDNSMNLATDMVASCHRSARPWSAQSDLPATRHTGAGACGSARACPLHSHARRGTADREGNAPGQLAALAQRFERPTGRWGFES